MIKITNRFTNKLIIKANSAADLGRADLSRADLRWADISGADLSRADLSGADLRWANLREADLSRADLREADLTCAYLSGANLSRADLREADLTCAYLSGANLRRADLRYITGNNNEVKSLQIGKYLISYHKDVLNIGCQSYTLKEWADFTDDKIRDMDTSALEWWNMNKHILIELVSREG